MGRRRHKRRAEQHLATHRRDELPRRFAVRRPVFVFLGCLLAIAGLFASAAIFGPPAGVRAYIEFAVFVTAVLLFFHNLAMYVLPAARGRSHPEPGITERGMAYGVSPIMGWFTRIDIHIAPRRSRRKD